MEIGAEISKKIRSAIKAKLVELGAYVDDELPDYIMVMVANKKGRDQMVDDLGLFLGNNSEKFASWLHDLLNKLQAISSDKEEKKKLAESKKSPQQSSNEPNSRVAEERKRTSCEGQGDGLSAKTRKVESAGFLGAVSGEKDKGPSSSGAVTAAAVKPLSNSLPRILPTSRGPDAEEPLLQVQADTDEFADELLLLGDEEEVVKKPVEVKTAPPRQVPVLAVKSAAREDPQGKPSAPALVWTQVAPTPKPVAPQITQPSSQDKALAASRKRRAPTSVVGNVRKGEEEAEEPYDPYNPAVGSVASVVKVTARKSSVPVALQANKSLLLKAVSDAEKSILSKKSTGTPSQAMISPIPREGGDLRDRLSAAAIADVRSRLSAVAAASDPRTRLSMSASSSGAGARPRPVLAVSASSDGRKRVVAARRLGEGSVKSRLSAAASSDIRIGVMRGGMTDARSKLPPSSTGNVESRLQGGSVYTSATIRPSAAPPLPRLRNVTRTIDVPEYIPTRKAIFVVRKEEDEKENAPDSRVVKMEEEDDSSGSAGEGRDSEPEGLQQEEVEEYRPEEVQVAPIPELLTDDNPEDYSFIEEEEADQDSPTTSAPLSEDSASQITPQKSLVQEKMKAADTKFIVTLDGVDFDDYERQAMEVEEEEDAAVDFQDDSGTNGLKDDGTASPTKKAPPKIKPFSINLKDSDANEIEGDCYTRNDDEMEPTSPLKQARSTERCRFWPACINGNACEYHHPTQSCKTFPNCKFGDKCLFIHPNCKFDARCTRPDCPYTHASRRNPVSVAAPQVIAIPHAGIPMLVAPAPQRQIPCRFFPNCTNLKCPFLHPKPCRYGGSCLNKSTCPFFHPAVPSKDKLKWTASGSMARKAL